MSTTNRRPNICDVCGRDNKGDEELCPWCFPPSEYANDSWTTQQGLDAAGFLLLAEAHLVKAREKLMAQPWSVDISVARGDVTIAIDHARGAMEVLKKEERCKR